MVTGPRRCWLLIRLTFAARTARGMDEPTPALQNISAVALVLAVSRRLVAFGSWVLLLSFFPNTIWDLPMLSPVLTSAGSTPFSFTFAISLTDRANITSFATA